MTSCTQTGRESSSTLGYRDTVTMSSTELAPWRERGIQTARWLSRLDLGVRPSTSNESAASLGDEMVIYCFVYVCTYSLCVVLCFSMRRVQLGTARLPRHN